MSNLSNLRNEELERFKNNCNNTFIQYLKDLNIPKKFEEQLKKDPRNDSYRHTIKDIFNPMAINSSHCLNYIRTNPEKVQSFVREKTDFELSHVDFSGYRRMYIPEYIFTFTLKK